MRKQGLWSVRFDARTSDGEPIYCLQTLFDLQCPPEDDAPRCLRTYKPAFPPPQIAPIDPPTGSSSSLWDKHRA